MFTYTVSFLCDVQYCCGLLGIAQKYILTDTKCGSNQKLM